MGTDYYPKAIIGVRLQWTKLFKEEWYSERIPYTQLPTRHREKCSTELSSIAAYCPSCGCGLKRKRKKIVALTSEIAHNNGTGDVEFHDWDVSITSDEPKEYARVFIGFNLTDGEESGVLSQIDVNGLNEKKNKLKVDLEEIGLWDESEFGLWSFMFVSC